MTYLDRESYGEMVTKRQKARIGVSSASLNDRSDRTLTLGMNSNGSILHVYIKDSVLYSHAYIIESPDGGAVTVTCLAGIVAPNALNPSFYAIPRATDSEFADLMLELNHPLDLASYDTSVNKVRKNPAGYFGRICSLDETLV